jgi:hypothetical protein
LRIFSSQFIDKLTDTVWQSSTTPPYAIPFALLLRLEKGFPVHRVMIFTGVISVPMGEIPLVGVVSARLPQTLPAASRQRREERGERKETRGKK